MNKSPRAALLRSTLVPILVLCAAGTSFAAIESVLVGKHIEKVQTDATTVILDPTPVSPTFGGPFGFNADVDGQNISGITAPTLSGPFNPANPGFNGGVLVYNPTDAGWRFGSSGNDWGAQSLAEINNLFPNGVYTFSVNGTNVALNLTGDAYPNDPVLTLTGGVWSGGKYQIDPSHDLTITTNAFTAYGTHVDDLIRIFVEGVPTSASQFHSDVPGTNFLSFTVPGGSFIAGHDYFGVGIFDAAVDENDAALPGSTNAAFYEVSTQFVVQAIPEPSVYVMVLAGVVLVGFSVRRRLGAHSSSVR